MGVALYPIDANQFFDHRVAHNFCRQMRLLELLYLMAPAYAANMAPGRRWIPADQLDFVLGALSRKRFGVVDVFAEGPCESHGRKRLDHTVW